MNILIIGEFSGFAKHLKNGFVSLGHNVVVVHNGDGFKKIPTGDTDIVYKLPNDINFLGHRIKHSHVLFNSQISKSIGKRILSKGVKYDLIIVVCSAFVTDTFLKVGVPIDIVKKYVGLGAKLVLTSCGGDPAYLKYLNTQKFFDIAFPDGIKAPSKSMYRVFDELVSLSSSVVVTAYDYYDTIHKYFNNDLHICMDKVSYIPLPVTYEKDTISDCTNRKIVLFHGVIRPVRKGTPYFEEALNRLSKEFPDKVEVIIDGKMPYEKYCDVLNRTDILLDQTNGYGTGINCALGLMKGKVVLSGNEPEERTLRGYESPVINATPNAEELYQTLKYLVKNPDEVMKLKRASRAFVLKYQESKIVAGQYLKLLEDFNF